MTAREDAERWLNGCERVAVPVREADGTVGIGHALLDLADAVRALASADAVEATQDPRHPTCAEPAVMRRTQVFA